MNPAVEIVKVRVEELPVCRLIGKRYVDADRDQAGSFHGQWVKWNKNRCCEPLLGDILPGDAGDVLGFMRIVGGVFEYWIGRFCRAEAAVPEKYQALDIAPRRIAVSFLRGLDGDPAIFAMHDAVLGNLAKQGFLLDAEPFFFERYSPGRFDRADEENRIVLDYGVTVRK